MSVSKRSIVLLIARSEDKGRRARSGRVAWTIYASCKDILLKGPERMPFLLVSTTVSFGWWGVLLAGAAIINSTTDGEVSTTEIYFLINSGGYRD